MLSPRCKPQESQWRPLDFFLQPLWAHKLYLHSGNVLEHWKLNNDDKSKDDSSQGVQR
jgi:hypothetical protein